jgi:arylformamidase
VSGRKSPFLILHVADHPETKAQSLRLAKVLQEAEGKTHGTINSDLGLIERQADP